MRVNRRVWHLCVRACVHWINTDSSTVVKVNELHSLHHQITFLSQYWELSHSSNSSTILSNSYLSPTRWGNSWLQKRQFRGTIHFVIQSMVDSHFCIDFVCNYTKIALLLVWIQILVAVCFSILAQRLTFQNHFHWRNVSGLHSV